MYSETFLEAAAVTRLPEMARATIERRRWPRAHLHWQVQFFGPDGGPILCTTRDVCSGGFYVLSERAFAPGERLHAILSMPSYRSRGGDESLLVRCRVEVVRVERGTPENWSGIACRILDYRALGGVVPG